MREDDLGSQKTPPKRMVSRFVIAIQVVLLVAKVTRNTTA